VREAQNVYEGPLISVEQLQKINQAQKEKLMTASKLFDFTQFALQRTDQLLADGQLFAI